MEEIFRAVYCEEVADLFKMLGLLDKLTEGALVCSVCGIVITAANFGAATRKSGAILLSCDREDCYNEFMAN
jgi:hypothetical protein